MSRRIFYGYEIRDGELRIGESAEVVKMIFSKYTKGTSLLSIQIDLNESGVETVTKKGDWSHTSIRRLLQNPVYIGTEVYPQIITQEAFDLAQQKIMQKARSLGRDKQYNAMRNRAIFADKIFCGQCNHVFKAYAPKYKKSRVLRYWRCKYKHHEKYAPAIRFTDQELENLILTIIGELKRTPSIVRKKTSHTCHPPIENLKLTREIHAHMEEYGADEVVLELAYKSASQLYEMVQVDREVYTGELIRSLSKEWRSITEEVFENIIDRIIILNENQLKVRLKNGVEVDMAYGTEV